MYPDRLYELAFAFRKQKLWKTLHDGELFAITLPNGETGYCSVMGWMGEHLALALYVGRLGLDSYRRMQEAGSGGLIPLKVQEELLSQACLQCAFESKDGMYPQELHAVRGYAAAHGIALRGANAFPQFVAYRPGYCPWPVSDEGDMALLAAALEAALAVGEMLRRTDKAELGFQGGPAYGRSVPLLTRCGEGFSWGVQPLPERQPVRYPEPVLKDELLMLRLRKSGKRSGVWVCDVVMLLQAAAEDEVSVPFFPYTLLAADCDTGMGLSTTAVADYAGGAEELLQALGKQMLEHGVPRQIQVVDARTQSLLKNLAAALKIRLVLQSENALLEELEEDFFNYFDDETQEPTEEEIEEFYDVLMKLDDDDFLSMPDELWSQLCSLERQGLLEGDVAKRLRGLSKWRK